MNQAIKHQADDGWVSKKGFAAEKVVTEDLISGWMNRYWTKGDQYVVIGRTTFIHRARANAWIGQQGSDPEIRSPDMLPTDSQCCLKSRAYKNRIVSQHRIETHRHTFVHTAMARVL